ncbi:MAG: iron-sulfur cluster assembly accessory protein [Patescibacteria group bacterium]|nr:iron-sulfur cluster assembly accessory protein [Patescibacteria group bacterium]MDE2015135.1 iron-sulfur cluster assembly accessory protein [Patescibacteria group bacterium]MDE2226563.1 iron-sulfur cluster assembly accessory protein [Patescibacteria group bacterium]
MDLEITPKAIAKIKELVSGEPETPKILGIRISVVGGGCSGFSYEMKFATKEPSDIDKIFELDGVKICVDQASLIYLKGTKIDYLETLAGAGFKFENPNVKSTCGCGESFSL